MDPIQLLIWFLVAIVVLGIIYYALLWIEVEKPLRNIILLVAALLLLLGALGKGRIY